MIFPVVLLLIFFAVIFFFWLPSVSHEKIAKKNSSPVWLHTRHGGMIISNPDWGLYYNRVRAAGDDPDDTFQEYFFRGASQVTRYSLMRKHYLKHGMNWKHHPDPAMGEIPDVNPASTDDILEIPPFLKKKP